MENLKIWHKVEQEINQKEKEVVQKKYEKIRKFDKREKYKEKAIDYLNNLGIIKKDKKETTKEIEENKKKHFYKEFNELSQEAQELARLRWNNLFEALRANRYYKDHINLYKYLLEDEIQKIRRESKSAVPDVRTPITDSFWNAIREFKKKQDKLRELTPESYIALHLQNFKKQVKYIQEGRIMETDYVQTMKEWVIEKMQEGSPIFLHGHLGGGKTDFAIHASIERMKNFCINRELKSWIEEQAEKDKDISLEEIMKQYRLIEQKYVQGIENNDEETMKKLRPYLIVGSKDFSLQDLYIEKTLKTENIFNTYDLQEHNRKIEEEFAKWLEDNKEKLENLSKEEQEKRTQAAAKRITDLYIKQHEGYGLAIKKIKKELMRAMEEGKPIIIDEVNAIPATLLISMNDILTTRPGKTTYVPGVGQVKVKDGFSIIMTGNLNNSPLVDYIGTEELNPAFLSRLRIKEYNYLPQNTSGIVYEQENPKENELFQVLIAFLANKDGSLKLPEGSLEKIFALAQLAKVTQRVFSGKWKESDVMKSVGDEMGKEPHLEKAVLSVRNLISVLNEWEKGFKKDLDKALWDGFISGITNPKDQNFIFYHARKLGFFIGSNWKEVIWGDLKDKEITLSWNDISNIPEKDLDKEYISPPYYYYSPREVIELLYGKAPDRIEFPSVDLEKLATGEIKLSLKDVIEIEKFQEETQKYLSTIEGALISEGCLSADN